MRNCLILMFLTVFQLFANDSYSQNARLTLNLNNVTVQNVLDEIETQSDFYFLCNKKLVDIEREISINLEDQKIDDILTKVFNGTTVDYVILDRQIVLSPNEYLLAVMAKLQSTKITGTVSDENGEPLPGVSISIKGTTSGTVTNLEGKYTIEVEDPTVAILVFSSVGYLTREISIGSQTTVSISLSPDLIGLEEVVVIGYGTVKKSDLTGSVSSVKSKELKAITAANLLQVLSGRSPGVQVKQNTGAPGAAVSVRIRGANSIQGSNEPLYVIDGFPSVSSNPTILNNSDIESIEILKDASAIAIYGSRGANGVVMITTNKGKAGITKVDFASSLGFQSLNNKLEMMNAEEYAILYNEQQTNDGLGPYFTQNEINSFGEGFDWQDFVYNNAAPIQNHSLTVSGGNEKTQFSLSGSIFDQEGIIKGSDYKRYSVRANINHNISKKFSVQYSAILSQNTSSRKNSEGARFGASLVSASLLAPPTLTPYNEDGSYTILHQAYPFISEGMTNPLCFINEMNDDLKANNVLANASLIFKPVEGLTLKVFGGIENSDSRNDYYMSLNHVRTPNGEASVYTNQFTSLLNENTLTYTKTFNDKHNISAVAGFTAQDFLGTSLNGSGSGFLSDVPETFDLSAADVPGIPGSAYSKSVLLSYLGRMNYSYNNRYLFTVSFRADGSSKYSEDNKWGYFPSAAFAWKLKEEGFLKDASFLTDLKLRASYGATGSQAINAYATLNNLYSGKRVFGDALYTTYAPSSVLPGDLKWETTKQTDIGIDVAILENRIWMTADYYIKNTSDLLNSVQLPASLGWTSTIRNVGEIKNQGMEFSIGANILSGAFQWQIDGNITFNKSKVIKLYDGQDIYGGYVDMLVFADNVTLLREGEEVSVFYGYTEDGYDEEGNIKYIDTNGDGSISLDDKTVIGNPNPDFFYGLNSIMSFKNINLTIFFQGSHGNDLANISNVDNSLVYGYGVNLLKEVSDNHWTPDNTDAKYPKITNQQSMNFSDRLVEDGSYLRLRNIELAYDFPLPKWQVNWIRSAQIFVSGQNLLTITKYSGWDPEVNSQGGSNSISQGIDHYSYPTAKSITFGVKVGF